MADHRLVRCPPAGPLPGRYVKAVCLDVRHRLYISAVYAMRYSGSGTISQEILHDSACLHQSEQPRCC